MKTLQEFINESILDDEDVLVKDAKNIVNDPVIIIHEMFENNEDQSHILELVDNGLLDGFLMDNFYIDRKKLGLSSIVEGYGDVKILSFYFKNLCDPLFPFESTIINFMHVKNASNISVRYITKEKLSSNDTFKSTSITDTKFYKQHSKIKNNLKKLGYKKDYEHEFIQFTKNL